MSKPRKFLIAAFAGATLVASWATPAYAGRTPGVFDTSAPTTTPQTDGGKIVAQPKSNGTVVVTTYDKDGNETDSTTVTPGKAPDNGVHGGDCPDKPNVWC